MNNFQSKTLKLDVVENLEKKFTEAQNKAQYHLFLPLCSNIKNSQIIATSNFNNFIFCKADFQHIFHHFIIKTLALILPNVVGLFSNPHWFIFGKFNFIGSRHFLVCSNAHIVYADYINYCLYILYVT